MVRNIIYVSSDFNNKNGANKSASDVLYSLIKSKFPITVLTFSSITNLDKNVFSDSDIESVKWIRVCRKIHFYRKISLKSMLKWMYYFFQNLKISKKAINITDQDIMIVNSIGGHQLLTDQQISTGCFKINIFRGSPESFGIPGVRFGIKDIITILKKYDCVIHVSDIVRKKWEMYEELKRINHLFIPNCCEEELINQIIIKDKNHYKNLLGINPEKYNLIYIASIQYRKGHDILIEKIPDIIKKVPDVEFYFIGKRINPFYSKILNTSKELGIMNKLHFLGEKSNALEFLYACDLLVFPSRAEAMPRVILESMILCTPIVTSDVDGIPELIENRKHGLLFQIENPSELIDHIYTLYANKKMSEILSTNAQSQYWENFSRQKHALRYKKLIDEFNKTDAN